MTRIAVVLATLALVLGACGSSRDDRRLTVFAASSLATVLEDVAAGFEREHDGVDVVVSSGGSSELAAQIVEGAPADVFAAADERTMGTVTAQDLAVGDPVVFATNTLRVVVPAGNPAEVASLGDLADRDTRVVVCAPRVPCGAATQTLLRMASLAVAPVSEEQSVADVLGKVRSGEADAGVVYLTDALAADDDVTVVEVPQTARVVNRYPAVALEGAADPGLAAAFIAYLAGPGRALLADAGFGAP